MLFELPFTVITDVPLCDRAGMRTVMAHVPPALMVRAQVPVLTPMLAVPFTDTEKPPLLSTGPVFSMTTDLVIDAGPLTISSGSSSWNSRWGRPAGAVAGGAVTGGFGGFGGHVGQDGHVQAPPINAVAATSKATPSDRTRRCRESTT
jgi:hypothetical protein